MFNFTIGFFVAIMVIIVLSDSQSIFSAINNNHSMIQAVGSIAVAIGVFVAIVVYLYDKKYRKSESIKNEAIRTLERAYSEFITSEKNIQPKARRLTWLSVSRMLAIYNTLKSKVDIEEHITQIEVNEQFWRLEFYKSLETLRSVPIDYFIKSTAFDADNLEPRSVCSIFEFTRWKLAKDSIQDISIEEIIKSGAILPDQAVVIDFLSKNGYDYNELHYSS